MKSFYSDYAEHCMRFYSRYPHPKFRNFVDKQNWNACDYAIKLFTNDEQIILMRVYSEGDTIPDNVYHIAKEKDMQQDRIWNLVNELERKVAKRRGLL